MTSRNKTTKKEIASYWVSQGKLPWMNVVEANVETCCWRCGIKKRLDRCHIVPRSQGGTDTPDNFVLLCKHCHFENPNLNDIEIVWDWLKAYRLPEDEPLWLHQGKREYRYIYGMDIMQRLEALDMDWEVFEPLFMEELKKGSVHFGQPGYNRATVAGAFALALKRIEESL